MENRDQIRPWNSFRRRESREGDGGRGGEMTLITPWPWSYPCKEAQWCLSQDMSSLLFPQTSSVAAPSEGAATPASAGWRHPFLGILMGAVCWLVEHLGFGIRFRFFPVLSFTNYMALGFYSLLTLEWRYWQQPGSWGCWNCMIILINANTNNVKSIRITPFIPPNETMRLLHPVAPFHKWANNVQRGHFVCPRSHVRGGAGIGFKPGSLVSSPLCLVTPPDYSPALYCLF